MKVILGMNLDGGAWPAVPGFRDAVVGELVTGPVGLLGVMENTLGLGGQEEAQASRIRQYMALIRECDSAARFYHDSFAADPWATARELLAWRDELILYGWHPGLGDAPPRLAALAEIEVASSPWVKGLGDRFQAVMNTLKSSPRLPIREIHLHDPEHLIPLPWQELLNTLRTCGVKVKQAKPGVARPQVQDILRLQADAAWPLAQIAARWLGQVGDAQARRTVLLAQHEGGLLDQALASAGLPVTGGVAGGRPGWHQLLPLVLENLWAPPRIHRLLELLSIEYGPIPRFAARHLLDALNEEAGLEGKAWQEALSRIRKDREKQLLVDGLEGDKARPEATQFAADLDAWLRRDRAHEQGTLSTEVAHRAIERLQRHLARYADQEAAAREAMRHCAVLRTILADLQEGISKPLLDAIVDDVIGPGSGSSRREASPWGVVDDAARLLESPETLIWWGFTDSLRPNRVVWSQQELQWLEGHGVRLDAPEKVRALERHHWLRVLNGATNVMLFQPLKIEGEAVPSHPLWSDIEAHEHLSSKAQTLDAIQLFRESDPELCGLSLSLEKVGSWRMPEPVARINVDADMAAIKPERLSPTRLEQLFGCPARWLFDRLEIVATRLMQVDEGALLLGNLAHKVLEDVFSREQLPSPDEAESLARESFEYRVPEMAAELLLPENESLRRDQARNIASAAKDIAAKLHAAGFQRVKCEEWIRTDLDGVELVGRADLIAYKDNGEPHVIDFKNSASSYYQRKIESGSDLQLISYARMIDDQPHPVAYYLVPRRELVTIFDSFGVDTLESDVPVEEGWERLRKTFWMHMAALGGGQVVVAGLLRDDEMKELKASREKNGEIHVEPPCGFCDFGRLCGVSLGGQHG